jgi:hypothetical protein
MAKPSDIEAPKYVARRPFEAAKVLHLRVRDGSVRKKIVYENQSDHEVLKVVVFRLDVLMP